jgi:putative ABC transport system permease protein
MIKNYLKVAIRNLVKNKVYTIINVGGLAVGMAVAILIGLWIYDELSFNKYHVHYDAIGQVMDASMVPETGKIAVNGEMPFPMAATLRNQYGHLFKHVLMATNVFDCTLKTNNNIFLRKGQFIEDGAIDMLSLKILKGSNQSLVDPHSIVISESVAEAIFGKTNPINKNLKINNQIDVHVTGIYEDLPTNNRFAEVQFFCPWALWVSENDWVKKNENNWNNRPFYIYTQLLPNVSEEQANTKIKNIWKQVLPADIWERQAKSQPHLQIFPMRSWHLYSEFVDGKPTSGRISFVWLFGIIGFFVLLLACINFMNLSTARSERRAKEVGIRKAIGYVRSQLIFQFFSESLLVVVMSFILSLLLVFISLSGFNELADKQISFPYNNIFFWLLSVLFIALTGILSGFYPALYLSSFKPTKVLKGVFKVGRLAALPRKTLVVVQFTVSMVLIIGTIVVYQQIQFAQNRPVGYDRNGLVIVSMNDPNFADKQETINNELLNTNSVSSVAFSLSSLTEVSNFTDGFVWPGKDLNKEAGFSICKVSLDFGKTVQWKMVGGRDFSKDFLSDSTALIINEAAAQYLNLKNPIGQTIKKPRKQQAWTIVGVVQNMVMLSPYEPVTPTFYFLEKEIEGKIIIKIKPTVAASLALTKIETTIKKLVTSTLFDYKFADDDYAKKFSREQRISKLATLFSIFAIFISCLGLFGLASFVAEQRFREIGIRKVLGASVYNLWHLLSKDFVLLAIISFLIATPISWIFMDGWLQKYTYRITINWWIFAEIGAGALVITLTTVSYQAIKAALLNPVKTLRAE